jgi:threonyl-tRNA synthetase
MKEILTMLKLQEFQILVRLNDEKDSNAKAINTKSNLKLLERVLAKEKLAAKIVNSEFYNYGAEISLYIKDLLGNLLNLSTIKLDQISSNKEELYYINKDNTKELPAVIRFNLIESFELLLKIILENSLGKLDVWIAPIQCVIIAISEKFQNAAIKIQKQLINQGLRVSVNLDSDTMQNKIRKAENDNIPYMLILGEKEYATNSVSLRQRNGQELGLIRIEEFIERIRNEIEQKVF